MMLFRNFLFYLGLIPATLLFTVLGLSFFFLPFHYRYFIITRWSYFFIFWVKLTCGLQYRVTGKEHIPKENAIVFANHQSMWETIFFQTLLPEQCWVLKKELLHIPIFGWGLALLEPIAINRKAFNAVKILIEQGFERLKKGRWVIIFPEGTRVLPTANKPFSRSGAALAEATQYPVLPIAHNAGYFWPRGFWVKKPGIIDVVIGPLLLSTDKSIIEINRKAEDWIKEQQKAYSVT